MTGRPKAAVTGATSFLGSATVDALHRAGYQVQAIVRPGTLHADRLPEDDEHIWYVPLKMEQYALTEKYAGYGDVWFHFAWDATSPEGRADEEKQAENLRHSLELLHGAIALGVKRFIFAGSQAEYGVHNGVITEETDCMPLSEYGKAKLAFGKAAARICQNAGVEFVHLRIFSVYGSGETPENLLSSCVRAFSSGGEMRLSQATQTWNYLHIEDFRRLMVCMATAEHATGIYNIGSLDTRPLKSFIQELQTICGGGSCLYGAPKNRPEGDVQLNPDMEKTMTAFDWRPEVSFEAGIRRMMERNNQ